MQPLGAVSVRMPFSATLPLTEAQGVTVVVELGTPPPTNPSTADAVPALQGVQTEGTLPPCSVMAAVPAAHLVQADAPTAGAKEPAAQKVQATAPFAAAKVPIGHCEQASAVEAPATRPKEPAGQSAGGWPLPGQYEPSGHGVDELAKPPGQKAPGGQKEQADRLVAPGTAENMAAGQGVGADAATQ